MPQHDEKACPKCKAVFACKAGGINQCRCFGLTLTEEQKAYIAGRYEDCLCRNCFNDLSIELNLIKEKYIFR